MMSIGRGRGFGALSVTDQQRLEAISERIFDMIDDAGRTIGTAKANGAISEEQANAFDSQLAELRNSVDDLGARIPVIAAQEIPALQAEFDSFSRRVSRLAQDVRNAQGSGFSSLLNKTGLWAAVAVVAAGAGAFWVVKYATKKNRRRRR